MVNAGLWHSVEINYSSSMDVTYSNSAGRPGTLRAVKRVKN
jgi:hypothetical protein